MKNLIGPMHLTYYHLILLGLSRQVYCYLIFQLVYTVAALVEVNCVFVESALFFGHDADFVGRTWLLYAGSIVVSIEDVENTASCAGGVACAEHVVGGIGRIVADVDDGDCFLDVLTAQFGGSSGGCFGGCFDDWMDVLLGGCFDGRFDEHFDDFLDDFLDGQLDD